jgi:pyruvate dehydrogenase E1 component alpha subunit
MITKQELVDFEAEAAAAFNAGKIRAPLHLSGGNEDQLIEVFSRVKPHDWVFSTWRSHYHALLHGVPREQLMAKILKGESISINVPELRFYSSAICGGCLPIALGVAWSLKRNEPGVTDCGNIRAPYRATHVWCFVGDMAAEMGCFHEAVKYAANHDLPVTFVVEDNQKCVNADTAELWGNRSLVNRADRVPINGNVEVYRYRLTWPHMGTGKFVQFPDEQKFSPTGGM